MGIVKRLAACAALTLALGDAQAQSRDVPGKGAGSGASSVTPPVTKSPAVSAEARRSRDVPLEPRHGLLGAPGAAQDSYGSSRLGGHGQRSERPSYGEAAQAGSGGGEAPGTWRSGDRIRSWSSADVRSARGQQAPDLEWERARAGPGGDPRLEPQVPYGIQFSTAQQKPRR